MNLFDLQATLSLDTSKYDQGIDESKDKATSFGDVFKGTLAANVISAGFSAVVNGTKSAVSALADMGKQAVDSYASYEQLVGGVETLFGIGGQSLQEYAQAQGKAVSEVKNEWLDMTTGQRKVLNNADQAYKTAGISANEYMENVMGIAAALTNSIDDTSAAADMADMAMRDMSDNANKMGSNMESIQNAYQGFAKQNYTMLDNLKLGYGGTKSEMERLIEDANRLRHEQGITTDLSIESFADIVEAIHTVQENMGITGTTAEEAMHTIEGSANATKAAWENVLTAIAAGDGLTEAMDGLVESLFGDGSEGSGFLANVIPRIQMTLEGIADFIGQAAPLFAEKIPGVIEELLPPMLDAIGSLVSALVSQLPGILEALWNVLLDAGTQLVTQLSAGWQGGIGGFLSAIGSGMNTALTTVLAAIPQMLQAGIQIVQNITNGVINGIPNVVSAASNIITQVVSTISTYGPQILAKGVELITNMRTGFLQALPEIIRGAGEIISQLLDALLQGAPKMLDAGMQLLSNTAKGIMQNLPEIIQATAEVIAKIIATIGEHLPEVLEQGIEILAQLAAGIIEGIHHAVEAVPQVFDSIVSAFKEHDWLSIGSNIIEGIGNGIRNGVGAIADAARSAASAALNAAKNLLGIASPSKVFRDEVGKMMMEGAAVGIEDNVPVDEISNAVDQIMGAAKDGIEDLDIPISPVVEGRNGRLGGGTAGGYGDITVNVYGSESMSIRELADAVMERIQTLTDRRVAVWA